MFHLLLLVAHLSGTPAFIVDVGLQYDSVSACEADAPRASGMLDRIFQTRNDGNDFIVTDHHCQREV